MFQFPGFHGDQTGRRSSKLKKMSNLLEENLKLIYIYAYDLTCYNKLQCFLGK